MGLTQDNRDKRSDKEEQSTSTSKPTLDASNENIELKNLVTSISSTGVQRLFDEYFQDPDRIPVMRGMNANKFATLIEIIAQKAPPHLRAPAESAIHVLWENVSGNLWFPGLKFDSFSSIKKAVLFADKILVDLAAKEPAEIPRYLAWLRMTLKSAQPEKLVRGGSFNSLDKALQVIEELRKYF